MSDPEAVARALADLNLTPSTLLIGFMGDFGANAKRHVLKSAAYDYTSGTALCGREGNIETMIDAGEVAGWALGQDRSVTIGYLDLHSKCVAALNRKAKQ